MDQAAARRLFAEARVATLATVTPEGRPHLVPCCFVLDNETIYTAIDTVKPKATIALKRLENIRANPAASLLVHQYVEDWAMLWWVRTDGHGQVVADEEERARALRLLAAKYDQYRESPPPGDVVALDVERWRWWPQTDEPTRVSRPGPAGRSGTG